MISPTARRVTSNTSPAINAQIRRTTDASIEYFTARPHLIPERLAELDREWNIERMLSTGSSVISSAGLVLGITRSRRWLMIPLVVQGFFLQHALQGWCPPLPVLRRLGFRTADEINRERTALISAEANPTRTDFASMERGLITTGP